MQIMKHQSKQAPRCGESVSCSAQRTTSRHGGAVLIMVVSLMTTLVVLGIFFYGLTQQELNSAEYFAAKEPIEIDPDPIFDTILRQAIVGPRANEVQSSLYGGHYAMLATIFGRPILSGDSVYYQPHAYTGRGAMIYPRDNDNDDDGTADPADGYPDLTWDIDGDMVKDVPGEFRVDYGNGTVLDQDDFVVNFSPAANGGTASGVGDEFNSNPGYTYPDMNSMFLAVDDVIPNEGNGTTYRLVMPSYIRPQMFTRRRFAGANGFGAHNDSTIDPMGSPPIEGVFEENGGAVSGVTIQTRNKVLRPHSAHRAIDGSGNVVGARFTDAAATAQSGDQNRIIAPFPFEVDVDNDGNANEMGLFTTDNAGNIVYEYDGDVDRDGVRDAILLDVGHEIIKLPNGREVVPLTLMKWIDNDGLLNVNAHGNMQRLVNDQVEIDDGNEVPFSASNQGLSSFEVNLGLGLTSNPLSNADIEQAANVKNRVFVNHNGMYGFNPNSRQEASNAELLRLLTGSFVYDRYGGTVVAIDDEYPVIGRYGNVNTTTSAREEVRNVETALNGGQLQTGPPDWSGANVPKPGATNSDDDQENGAGNPMADYVKFGHPLDHLGLGNASEVPSTGTNRGNRRRLIYDGTNPDVQIPRMAYDQDWIQSQLPNAYEPSPTTNLRDEPDETVVEPSMRTTTDTLFETAELFSLHASDADLAFASIQSRLLELASFNFRDSRRAAEIRKRFTTDSWDRLEFTHRPERLGANRGWEFNEWTEPGGATFSRNNISTPLGTATISYDRAFPPQFGDPSVNPNNIAVFQPADPFRANLRRLLTTRVETNPSTGSTPIWNALRSSGELGQRLNLNRYLSGFQANGAPIFERLTEHPTGLTATPPNPGDPEDDARIERQRLARDIYVLLYILGGERDNSEYTWTDPNDAMPSSPPMGPGNGHTLAQMEDMAQFAVNIVDALDTDSVTTRFKYDTNLSNGWNLSDDAYDDEGPATDYAFVDGIEEQQVTLSEAMFVFSEGDTAEADTEWDDTEDHSFAYIELFNTGLGNVDWDNQWQIRLEIPQVGAMSSDHFRELTLDTGTLSEGGFFTIGGADRDSTTALNDAVMRIRDSSMALQDVAPALGGRPDLDLVYDSRTGMAVGYTLVDPNGDRNVAIDEDERTGGDFFPHDVASALEAAGGEINIILRKRANLVRTAPSPTYDVSMPEEQDDNPWIEVDRMEIEVVADTSDNGFVDFDANQLGAVESIERKEPFNRRSEVQSVGGETGGMADPVKQNSLGQFNVDTGPNPTPTQFDLWQVHFNRDFSSVAELLSIPLYGPSELTMQLGEHLTSTESRLSGFYDDLDTGQFEPSVAGSLILYPDPSILANAPFNLNEPTNWTNGNRWHRLFEFLTVVPQNLERIGDYDRTAVGAAIPMMRRTPGKINLNTVRHESVLAGLVDDAMIDRFGNAPTNSNAGFDNGRNWFRELVRSREPVDHFLYFRTGGPAPMAGDPPIGERIRIPGVPGSNPFMSHSYYDQYGEAAIQAFTPFRKNNNVVLQPVPGHTNTTTDAGTSNSSWRNIGLFDARASSDVGQDTVDYHTRHRIFSKVLNNTTNRSHVYSGWIEIVFHEAHTIDDGTNQAVQLGAEAEDLPRYRLFCVVDLSRLEEAYNPNTGTFDFEKFIIHRQQLP